MRSAKDIHESELCLAAGRGDFEKVGEILASGANPDERDWDDRTALHRACANGSIETIGLLLEAGADIEAKTGGVYLCKTPLLCALPLFGSAARMEPAALLLLEAGADPKSANSKGQTALHHAAQIGSVKVLELIAKLAPDWDLRARDCESRTALHFAAQTGWPGAISWLLSQGFDPNAVDERGNSALHACAAEGYLEGCELLLQAGADPRLENKEGVVARDLAVDQPDILALLEAREEREQLQAHAPMRKSKKAASKSGARRV